MKTNYLAMIVAVGMLAALPARAWTWNSGTYASRFRPAPETTQKKSEIQVAVMANSTSDAPATRSGTKAKGPKNPHPFGPPKPFATKSH